MTDYLEIESGSPTGEQATTLKSWIIFGFAMILIMFVLQDLLDWINGGGIFSLFAADHAINAKAAFIDVDSNALRVPFIAILCPIVIGLCILFGADMSKRWHSGIIILGLIGGSFILDGVYGHRIITHFMAIQGYDRCSARDHEVGSGKGRVWFDDYVRAPGICPRLS
jgi:hypothetical protein